MQFKVMKGPVKDSETGFEFNEGDIIDITLKRVTEFEKKYGVGWFERVTVDE